MFGRIVLGILIVVVGYFITTKANWILANFGRLAWFEAHFGTEGGTRFFYKALGILTIIGGFMYATGMLQALLRRIFTPYFNIG